VINIAQLIKEFLTSFIKAFVNDLLADFLILAGITWIVFTTYKINVIVGNYLLGAILLLIGILIAKSKN